MVKITKRVVEAAEVGERDYLIWDDEMPGFGLRIFSSGQRSYVIQYRTRGRSRRYTIGLHGAWAPETARREASVQLGRVAGGDDPVEDRQRDHKAINVKESCAPATLPISRPASFWGREADRRRRQRSSLTPAVSSV